MVQPPQGITAGHTGVLGQQEVWVLDCSPCEDIIDSSSFLGSWLSSNFRLCWTRKEAFMTASDSSIEQAETSEVWITNLSQEPLLAEHA